MTIPKLPTTALDDINHQRRHREVTNSILDFTFDDSRVRTQAEIAAGVTPVNYAYPPRQPGRYSTSENISDAADLFAVFGSPRTRPSGFGYVSSNIFECAGPGLASHDFDAETNFLSIYALQTGATATGQYWVDGTNGNDANTGGFNDPYKTIRACIQGASGLSIIWLLPGVYVDGTSRFDVRGADNTVSAGVARAIRIKAWAGLGSVLFRATGDQPGVMTWALTGGTSFEYEATPSGGETAVHIIFHDDGGEIQIQWYSSAAAVNAVASGWFQDAGTKKIYIRYQNRDLTLPGNAARFEIMYTGNNPICLGGKIYVQDVIFRGCPEFEASIQTSGGNTYVPVMYARNCRWQYLQYHNFASIGAITLLQDCISEYALGGDGFNYTDGTQSCQATEVDCIGRNNGVLQYKDFDGDRNKQGSSTHNSAIITRVNGQYYGNYGQDIADTGTGSKTWMVGSICGAPFSDLASNVGINGYSNLWTEGTAWLDCVKAGTKAATYGLWVESGTANLFNCDFYGTTGVIGKNTGVTALYDPRA